MSVTLRAFSSLTSSAVWFFSGGIAIVLTGALNLLSRKYGATAPGLRWFCIGTNVAMTGFALVAGRVGQAGIGQLVTIVGGMAATTVLSLTRAAIGSAGQSGAV